MSSTAGNSIRSFRSPAVSAARRDGGKASHPTSDNDKNGSSLNSSKANSSSAHLRSQIRSQVLPSAPLPPSSSVSSLPARRPPTHNRNIPFHSGSNRTALPPAVLPRPHRGASQPQLPAAVHQPQQQQQSLPRQRANSHNVDPRTQQQQQQRTSSRRNSSHSAINSSYHTSVDDPVQPSASTVYTLPRERGVYPGPYSAARPSPPPQRVSNDGSAYHRNDSINNNNENDGSYNNGYGPTSNASALKRENRAPQESSRTSPPRKVNGVAAALVPERVPQQQQQKYTQPLPPRVQAGAGGVYLESMDTIPKTNTYALVSQEQNQRWQDYSTHYCTTTTTPAASTALALRTSPPSGVHRRRSLEVSCDRGTTTDDLGAYAHATPTNRTQPPEQQRQQRYRPEEVSAQSFAVTHYKLQGQQYAVRPADYYLLAPSLRLVQHRHVRRIVAGEINREPPQTYYQPLLSRDLDEQKEREEKEREANNERVAQPPPPHRGPPPLPPDQQQQQQKPRKPLQVHHVMQRPELENSTSMISETSSTRSSHTRQVFRRPQHQQQKQRVFLTGALPAGSPYGAKPTYAVVMPRTRRVPAGLYTPPSLVPQQHYHQQHLYPYQQQQKWEVPEVEPTVEEPYFVLDEEGGRVVEYEPDLSQPAPPQRQHISQQQQPVRVQPRPPMHAPPPLPPQPQYAERPVPVMRQVTHYYSSPRQQWQEQDVYDKTTPSEETYNDSSCSYSSNDAGPAEPPPKRQLPQPPAPPRQQRLHLTEVVHLTRTPSNSFQQAPPPTLPPPRPLRQQQHTGDDEDDHYSNNEYFSDVAHNIYPTRADACASDVDSRPSARDQWEQPSSATPAMPLKPGHRLSEHHLLYLRQRGGMPNGSRLTEGEKMEIQQQRHQQQQPECQRHCGSAAAGRRPRVQDLPHSPQPASSPRSSGRPGDAYAQSLCPRTQVTPAHQVAAKCPPPPPPPPAVLEESTEEDYAVEGEDEEVAAEKAPPQEAEAEKGDEDEELEVPAEALKKEVLPQEPQQQSPSTASQKHLIVQDPNGSRSFDLETTIDSDDLQAQQEANKLAAELVRRSLLPPTPYTGPQPMEAPAPYSSDSDEEEEDGGDALKAPSTKARNMLHNNSSTDAPAATQEEAVVVSAEGAVQQPTEEAQRDSMAARSEDEKDGVPAEHASAASAKSEVPHSVHVAQGKEAVTRSPLVQKTSMERLDLAAPERQRNHSSNKSSSSAMATVATTTAAVAPTQPSPLHAGVCMSLPKPPEQPSAIEEVEAVRQEQRAYPEGHVHVPPTESVDAAAENETSSSNSLLARRRDSRDDATEEDVDVNPSSDREHEHHQHRSEHPIKDELALHTEEQQQPQVDQREELDLTKARNTQRLEEEDGKLREKLAAATKSNNDSYMRSDEGSPFVARQLATPLPRPVPPQGAATVAVSSDEQEPEPERQQSLPIPASPTEFEQHKTVEQATYVDEEEIVGEGGISVSPLDIGESYGYVDPLDEAATDAAYMLDTLEDQYVRVNEETGEEMEDVVHVVELNRYDRATEPRYFIPKGQYSDVLPLLRYPTTAPTSSSAADENNEETSASPVVSNTDLTYIPLTNAGYVNLCAVIWLSRFHAEDIARLVAVAQGPTPPLLEATVEGDENSAPTPPAYYFDHPSSNLLEQLDNVISLHVRSVVDKACGQTGASFATACVRLADRNNLAYLPPAVWQQATTASTLHATSIVDHVTEVLLTATVPQEAVRRQAVRRTMTSDLESQAQKTWSLFLGALPWNYEEVVEAEMFAAMPTPAARLSYAFMYKARMQNLEGGLGALTFSTLSAQIPDSAVMDSLLMQEKLRLALLYSYKNVAACCALRRKAVKGRCVSSPLGSSQLAGREHPNSTDNQSNNNNSHSGWNSPVFSSYMKLWGDEKTDADSTLDDSEEDGVVDLYSVAVQLGCFFPTKTERGIHQLCAALIEDLISMDALIVPNEVCTPDGVVLTERTAILDALVVEGAQAMRYIITTLSEVGYVNTISTDDYISASSGRVDAAEVRCAMEKYLVLFDPGVMYFLSSRVPVDNLFQYVRMDGPPSMQPYTTGRKSTFVEVLRLQHIAETIQYAMEMQDAILVASQYNHLVSVHYKRIKQQLKARPTPRSVAEELQLDNVVVGQSMDLILNAAPLLSREHESNESLLGELANNNGDGVNATNHHSADRQMGEDEEDVMLGQGESGGDGANSGEEVLLRAVLVALCSADPQKPVAEVQDYLRHLLALYAEIRDEYNNPIKSSDPLQVAHARATAAELALVDWFGQTNQDGTLMRGAAPARCDKTRVNAEDLAALCPRVLGRRVGLPSSAVADAAAAISASAQASAKGGGSGGFAGGGDNEDSVLLADTASHLPLAR